MLSAGVKIICSSGLEPILILFVVVKIQAFGILCRSSFEKYTFFGVMNGPPKVWITVLTYSYLLTVKNAKTYLIICVLSWFLLRCWSKGRTLVSPPLSINVIIWCVCFFLLFLLVKNWIPSPRLTVLPESGISVA